jgi:hypothetical protein
MGAADLKKAGIAYNKISEKKAEVL